VLSTINDAVKRGVYLGLCAIKSVMRHSRAERQESAIHIHRVVIMDS